MITRLVTQPAPRFCEEISAICLACIKLNIFQLQKVYYAGTRQDAANAGFDDSYIYDQFSIPPGEGNIPMLHLIDWTSHAAFDAWLNFPDKINY